MHVKAIIPLFCNTDTVFCILLQGAMGKQHLVTCNSDYCNKPTPGCCVNIFQLHWPFIKSALTVYKCIVLYCSKQHCEYTWDSVSSDSLSQYHDTEIYYRFFYQIVWALHTLHWETRARAQGTGARQFHTCLLQAPPAGSLQHLRPSGRLKMKRGDVRGPLRRANVERRPNGVVLWLLSTFFI